MIPVSYYSINKLTYQIADILKHLEMYISVKKQLIQVYLCQHCATHIRFRLEEAVTNCTNVIKYHREKSINET